MFRRVGRVVYCIGLENRRLERVREFESHILRQTNLKKLEQCLVFGFQFSVLRINQVSSEGRA